MSLVHRVIILNKPLKIRGFSILQWCLMVLTLGFSFGIFTLFPKEWKLGNLPTGFIVALCFFCAVLMLINALELKPLAWWRNRIFYGLNVLPIQFLPHPEEAQPYPDSSIVEAPRERDKFYVE